MNRLQCPPLPARIALLMVCVLMIAGTSGVARADSAPSLVRPARGAVVSSAQDGVKPAAARAWTTAEMLSARPYPQPETSVADLAGPTGVGPDGLAGSLPAKQPDAFSTFDLAVNPSAYPSFPYSTVGRLFFTQYGTTYVCTGAMIKGHAFWTAGRCAHAGNGSPGGWSTNAVFVPQYYYGSAPLGYCYVQSWWTTMEWYVNGALDHNYAGGNLSCDYRNIANYTGYLGLAWNQGYSNTWTALDINGVSCTSGLVAIGPGSPPMIGIACNTSTGSPWIIGGSYLNGNTSHRESNLPGVTFSPYYDRGVYTLWTFLWS